MTTWPKDTQAARNAFYGDPGKGQIASQMVAVVPPFAMYYEGKRVRAIQFHHKAAPALLAALNEIWDFCQHDQAKIDAAGVSKYAGAYNPRMVRGSKTKWSNHAYAAAIDLNAGENALGVKKGTMPQFVVDAFCRQGAMWGGWYSSRPDWMHFEFVDNGGRKPKSSPPVWPPVARLFAEPEMADQAPADELEDEDAPAGLGDGPGADQLDPVLLTVQTDLKAMNYNPGIPSGFWGGMTAGAIAGFINDYSSLTSAPASYDEFVAVRSELLERIAEVKARGDKRPVTAERAKADAKTVATVAPEVVPSRRNFLTAAWAAVVAFVTALADSIVNTVNWAWSFFTGHRDQIPTDSGLLRKVWAYVGEVPPIVWLLLVGAGLSWLAWNAFRSTRLITESVQTGARQ